jgi:hypothetical protein
MSIIKECSMISQKNDSNLILKRFIKFFKRFASKKQQLEIDENLYQRDFDRFPVKFEVQTNFIDADGEELEDRADLHDISGSGAMFLTRIPEKYYLGQTLQLKIFLAGTEDVRACIKSESSVVRMQKIYDAESNDNGPTIGIAVKFQKAFEFERVDKNVFGGNR